MGYTIVSLKFHSALSLRMYSVWGLYSEMRKRQESFLSSLTSRSPRLKQQDSEIDGRYSLCHSLAGVSWSLLGELHVHLQALHWAWEDVNPASFSNTALLHCAPGNLADLQSSQRHLGVATPSRDTQDGRSQECGLRYLSNKMRPYLTPQLLTYSLIYPSIHLHSSFMPLKK